MLDAAPVSSDHPYSVPGLSTCDSAGVPRSRRVVLRAADAAGGRLKIYTDRRSVKARHLAAGSEFTFLFWDPDSSVQLTCGGPARWAPEEEAERVFADLPKHSRKAYATLGQPASPLEDAGTGLPADWEDRSLAETDYALPNFGIVITDLRWADLLHLDRSGNTRMAGTRGEGNWEWRWITP